MYLNLKPFLCSFTGNTSFLLTPSLPYKVINTFAVLPPFFLSPVLMLIVQSEYKLKHIN